MICHVKYRVEGVLDIDKNEWFVVHNVPSDTFTDAEIQVRKKIAAIHHIPESWVICMAYRGDAKSVWKSK